MPEQQERFPYSLDEIDDIMAGNDASRHDALRALLKERQGMNDADIDRAMAARKVRRAVHAAGAAALAARVAQGAEPTDEERSMRAFVENLEEPVREAVLTLRRKGYDTVSSGFSDFDWQSMVFSRPELADLPEDVLAALEGMRVTVNASGDELAFRPETIDAESIRNEWNRIAELLPDRGTPAPSRVKGGTADFNAWERRRKT